MSTVEAALTRIEEQSVLGHPKGLLYLAFTEVWERFSFYGMNTLLALYMVNQLLLPGHVENVSGFAGFRSALESVAGTLSTQALASRIFGLYSGFVYFTPMLGGWIADRWIGQRNAVVLGALLMSGGHLAMAFEQSFLLALLLLVIGSGFLKGNISAQVGTLYPRGEVELRTRGFGIFSMAINFGAVAGPLLCGLLAEVYGWHYGFGVAGIFMLAGLATYLYGFRYLPARVVQSEQASSELSSRDWKITFALIGVMGITIFQAVGLYQIFNVFPIWIQQNVDLTVGSFVIPIPWFVAMDPLTAMFAAPLLFSLWRWQSTHGGEPDDLKKIGIGSWLCAGCNLILVGATLWSGGGRIHPIWPFLYSVGLALPFLYHWPTLLALVSRAAPSKINSTMMGCAFLSLFIANNLIGWIGGFYEQMGPIAFWGMHAAISAAGGVVVLLTGRRLRRVLAISAS